MEYIAVNANGNQALLLFHPVESHFITRQIYFFSRRRTFFCCPQRTTEGRNERPPKLLHFLQPLLITFFFLSLSVARQKNRKDKFVKMEIEQLAFFCFRSNYLRYVLSCLLSKNKCKCIHTQLCASGKKAYSYLHIKQKCMSYCIKAIV